jgi:hypothetical protein
MTVFFEHPDAPAYSRIDGNLVPAGRTPSSICLARLSAIELERLTFVRRFIFAAPRNMKVFRVQWSDCKDQLYLLKGYGPPIIDPIPSWSQASSELECGCSSGAMQSYSSLTIWEDAGGGDLVGAIEMVR